MMVLEQAVERDQITVAHVSVEVAPWSRKGGLGTMVSSLSLEMARQGVSNVCLLPWFAENSGSTDPNDPVRVENLPVAPGHPLPFSEGCSLHWLEEPDDGRAVVAFESAFPYDYSTFHTDYHPLHQPGIDRRYLLFAWHVAHFLSELGDRGTCFIHDWQGAALNIFRKICPGWRVVHVTHNMEFVGEVFSDEFSEVAASLDCVDEGNETALSTASSFAHLSFLLSDVFMTVSCGYAAELTSGRAPHASADFLLNQEMTWIQNGFDDREWSPSNDAWTPPAESLKKWKDEGRAELNRSLRFSSDRPLVVMVSRLTPQKGVSYLIGDPPQPSVARERIVALTELGCNIVVCGVPDGGAEGVISTSFRAAARVLNGRFVFIDHYSERLGHDLLRGADFLLFPSVFEPAALTVLQALAYGTVPIATEVGGLPDVVGSGCGPEHDAVGIRIEEGSFEGLSLAVSRALRERGRMDADWGDVVSRAVRQAPQWSEQASQYIELAARQLPEVRQGLRTDRR